ncbi:guanylate cyclase 32E-like [Halyomorpha halys]|uniref:guanylate cyclase 32E-like n=1 Tax=Halyomorpha halys TaxID=286706 RepID=UPI0006D4FF31
MFQKCADKLVSDKRVYHTFARTLPPSTKVSKSVVALLTRFKWFSFVIVYEKSPSFAQVKDAIKELATENGLVVTEEMEFKDDYIPKKIRELENIIEVTFQRTRVYVFVGDHVALVDFVKCLRKRGLLEKGEYIVISADDEIYNPERRKNIIQRDYLDPWLQDPWFHHPGVRPVEYDIHGFRSVLKLTTSHPSNPEYKSICEEVKKISTRPPFCVPHHSTIFGSMPVPIHAAHLYDAVMIYARALTEVLEAGEDPRNGTVILERILNRSYRSVLGYDLNGGCAWRRGRSSDLDRGVPFRAARFGCSHHLGEDSVPITVVKYICQAYGGTQTAVISLPVLQARKVMAQGKVRVGLAVSRVRERLRVPKCFRCWEYGRIAWNCGEKDRTTLCRNCDKTGHKVGNGDAYHPSGSSKCPAFRSALKTMTQTQQHRR